MAEAFRTARAFIAAAPVLIPIYSHRYLPATPCVAGNPVFSVYQTDIIYYGANLANYFANEFPAAFGTEMRIEGEYREIEFWTWLESLNRLSDEAI